MLQESLQLLRSWEIPISKKKNSSMTQFTELGVSFYWEGVICLHVQEQQQLFSFFFHTFESLVCTFICFGLVY